MKGSLEKEDAILSEVLESLSTWKDTVVIGGGYALIAYRLYFADENASIPAATRDIDSILPRKISQEHSETLKEVLKTAGFTQEFKDRESPPTEGYFKEIEDEEIELEFLTDKRTRGDKDSNVVISGVVAQPLSYIEMSYENILDFTTKSGVSGKCVDPAAWIFHKLLTFPKRRSGTSKFYKDLYGVWFVANELGEFSKKSRKGFKSLATSNNAWFKTAKQNVANFISGATPDDWNKLETQDSSGRLKKAVMFKTFSDLGIV